ncbi:MAG: hypothetical protein HKO84_00610 [Pseudomonadales bacterium]|nr:hypothetical protein [Pseudomonadales bacterium]
MLQNLLGLSVSGFALPADGGDGATREPLPGLGSGSDSFDNLLKNNNSFEVADQGVASGSPIAADQPQAAVLAGERLAQLQLALQELAQALQANGRLLPQSGSDLPQALPHLEAIAAELGELADLVTASPPGVLPLQRVQALVADLRNLLPELVAANAGASQDTALAGLLPTAGPGLDASTGDDSLASRGVGLLAVDVLKNPALSGAVVLPALVGTELITEGKPTQVKQPQVFQPLGNAIERLAAALSAHTQSLKGPLQAASSTAAAILQPGGRPENAGGNAGGTAAALGMAALKPGLANLPDGAALTAASTPPATTASQAIAKQLPGLGVALQATPAGLRAPGSMPVGTTSLHEAFTVSANANGSAANFAALLASGGPVADASLLAALAAAQEAGAGPAPLAASALGFAIGASQAAPPMPMASIFSTEVALPVLSSHWGQQLTQRLGWLAGQGIHSAEIQLNPPELGPIQVRIDSAENAARVTISVHSSVTREAMEAQIPRLRDLFAEQGLDLVDVDVGSGAFADDRQAGEMLSEDGEQGRQEGQDGDESIVAGEELAATARSQPPAQATESGALQHIVLHYSVDAYA